MSDKRYPTRMHEVLGVEPEEWFTYSEYGDRRFWLSESGLMYRVNDGGTSTPTTQWTLVFFINNLERITRRPRLTEEQEAQLKALDTLGFKWLAKDENDEVAAFKGRPDKGRGQWQDGGEYIVLYPFMPTNCLMDLLDWSDPAPLDIVQVLRQNGVEVEG